ncbi:MAG: VCBS repeat-containing protein [Candidatus Gastranaerophilales bacterium]|nr:VCBS repeat-containing protein [Candidatus Gastranaerophilales bacterium]
MEKITAAQFESLKEGLVTTSFEMLDVNGDNVIDEKDLAATQNAQIRSDIQKLLDSTDEEPSVDGEFNPDEVDGAKANVKAAAANEGQKASTVANTPTPPAGGSTTYPMPTGYENVDVSEAALKGKTTTELTAMLNKINNNITLLNTKLTSLASQKQAKQQEIDQLNNTNNNLRQSIAAENSEWTSLNNEKTDLVPRRDEAKETLDIKVSEYDGAVKNLAILNSQIANEQWFEELFYENKVKTVSDDIIATYDPSKDGTDFTAFYLRKMGESGCSIFAQSPTLEALNGRAQNGMDDVKTRLKAVIDQSAILAPLQKRLNEISTRMEALSAVIQPVLDQIAANDTLIATKTTERDAIQTEYNFYNTALTSEQAKKTVVQSKLNGGGLSAKEILALIPQAEKDLAKNNNVDLTKCYAAKGKQDGKWHLYMSNGTSLARKYGKNSGFDIVASGNGYVNGLKEKEGGQAVYYFTEVNEDMTDGKVDCKYCDYTTSSPLSFDVDGDGVHTTTDTVNFDIDGDGEMDVINNSAEWVLAFDKDHNGVAGEDGSELFGDNTDLDGDGQADGYKDGFEALKALALKEGLIGDGDTKLDADDIAFLSEKYGLVMTNGYGGEAKSLADLGITEINLATTDETTLNRNVDGQQNDVMTQEGATFTVNGETRTYADIWHSKKGTVTSDSAPAAAAETPKEATTNDPELTLKLNKDGIIALKGKVDYQKILNSVKNKVGTPQEAEDKIAKYNADMEEQEQEKQAEALKAEEMKKQKIKEDEKNK